MGNLQQETQRERCIPQETSIHCVRLATAYVPFQRYCGVWSPCRALRTGTAFPELFSPYSKREYANLEPEVTCPQQGSVASGARGREGRRPCHG